MCVFCVSRPIISRFFDRLFVARCRGVIASGVQALTCSLLVERAREAGAALQLAHGAHSLLRYFRMRIPGAFYSRYTK